MNWALFGFAALWIAGTLILVSRVGEPRKPIAPKDVALTVAVNAALVTLMVLAGLRLT